MRKFIGLRAAAAAAALTAVGLGVTATTVHAEATAKKEAKADAKKGLELGDAAPTWKGLEGIDGAMYTTWQDDFSGLEAFAEAAWDGKP